MSDDLHHRLDQAANRVLQRPLHLADLNRRAAHRRRQRSAQMAGLVGVVLIGGAVIAFSPWGRLASPEHSADDETLDTSATPCASPYAASVGEQRVSIPTGGAKVRVQLHVGDHITVGWSRCDEFGTFQQKPAFTPDGPLQETDAGGCGTPPHPPILTYVPPPTQSCTGLQSVRFQAQRVGSVELRGTGNHGTTGYVEITVSE